MHVNLPLIYVYSPLVMEFLMGLGIVLFILLRKLN